MYRCSVPTILTFLPMIPATVVKNLSALLLPFLGPPCRINHAAHMPGGRDLRTRASQINSEKLQSNHHAQTDAQICLRRTWAGMQHNNTNPTRDRNKLIATSVRNSNTRVTPILEYIVSTSLYGIVNRTKARPDIDPEYHALFLRNHVYHATNVKRTRGVTNRIATYISSPQHLKTTSDMCPSKRSSV